MGRPGTARVKLLESARDLIHASNYGSASVDDLCTAAGVNKGSFYYYFPSKRDLALAVLDAQWAQAQERVLEPCFSSALPPLERITGFFARVADVQRRPVVLGCPFGNLAVELATIEPMVRDRVAEIMEGYRSYFARALQDAIDSGAIESIDVPTVSLALVALFQGAMVLAKTHNDATMIERVGAQALALVDVRHGKPMNDGGA
jgi:TetR/AcrR family transcriptional repressor of nem operon